MTDKNLQKAKEIIAERSGLPMVTVEALLKAGYSYNDRIATPIMWIRDGQLFDLKAIIEV